MSIFKTIIIISILANTLGILGQSADNRSSQKPELVERFEKVVSSKEPKFIKNKSRFGERIGKFVGSSMNWKQKADVVYLYLSEFDTNEDAKMKYQSYISLPSALPVEHKNITNLGDEAFSQISAERLDNRTVSIVIRKGHVLLFLTSNNFLVAKRFSLHFVREIEKRDRGEL